MTSSYLQLVGGISKPTVLDARSSPTKQLAQQNWNFHKSPKFCCIIPYLLSCSSTVVKAVILSAPQKPPCSLNIFLLPGWHHIILVAIVPSGIATPLSRFAPLCSQSSFFCSSKATTLFEHFFLVYSCYELQALLLLGRPHASEHFYSPTTTMHLFDSG